MKIRNVLLVPAMLLALLPSAFAQATPPWSRGENNPAASKGYVFQVEDVDNVPDLHGNPEGAALVLFIGGNQFFALPKLIAGFEKLHPELRGAIFCETLPPGILQGQMANNNTITLGNLTLRVQPDVFEAGANVLAGMVRNKIVEKAVTYATNDLVIMVKASNPKQIRSLRDLARPGVRLSMPNPQWEGIAAQIGNSLRKAGGDALYRAVYETKARNQSTFVTHIHHRETPMRILKGDSDAGVTWASEVRFQQMIGNPIAGVDIPSDQNFTGIYAAGVLRDAPHAVAARAWVAYLTTPQAQAVYKEFGFKPAP
jgi:ABC-type molybdate transport system substrate-binding protein